MCDGKISKEIVDNTIQATDTYIWNEDFIHRDKDKITFGKYNGHSIGYIYLMNKNYLDWCLENISGFNYVIEDQELIRKQKEENYNNLNNAHDYLVRDCNIYQQTLKEKND